MSESTQRIATVFDRNFLKTVDKHWKQNNFKNRTEYILFLIRNDLQEAK